MRANTDRAPGVRLVTDPVGAPSSLAPLSIAHLDYETPDIDHDLDLVALCGRFTAGLGVQLLTTRGDDVRAFITLALDGETETFEIRPEDALDAFHHPFAYGGTLL